MKIETNYRHFMASAATALALAAAVFAGGNVNDAPATEYTGVIEQVVEYNPPAILPPAPRIEVPAAERLDPPITIPTTQSPSRTTTTLGPGPQDQIPELAETEASQPPAEFVPAEHIDPSNPGLTEPQAHELESLLIPPQIIKQPAVGMDVAETIPSPLDAHVQSLDLGRYSVSTPHPNMALVEGSKGGSNFYAAIIDLGAAGVEVAVSPGESPRIVGEYAKDIGAQIAVNGNFFGSPLTGGTFFGPSISDGELLGGPDGSDVVSFGFTETGRVVVHHMFDHISDPTIDPLTGERIVHLVSGRPTLVFNGVIDRDGVNHRHEQPGQTYTYEQWLQLPPNEVMIEGAFHGPLYTDSPTMTEPQPRTALIIDQTGHFLITLVVDGRGAGGSRGMTGLELAIFALEDLGAYHAIGLDGGGSSTMWIAGQGIINNTPGGILRPTDNQVAIITAAGSLSE